eukprot:TRINITY_DN103746_c0_g1_i1.p1 TRINITY_DN103746_c0_g1~~TRINITY_DN103746_c0_g1_i1.p1  ORF type:complete len:223 (+),score=15.45 TRINITY_DN103746_c0_g1_i1:52-720(+)
MTAQDTKRVALIRHGHGHHNPAPNSCSLGWIFNIMRLTDSPLSDIGRNQARAVHDALASNPDDPLHGVEVVISSPLSRCIETSLLIFGDSSKPPRCISPLHTERCIGSCDCGQPPDKLASEFPSIRNWEGFADLPEVWWPQERGFFEEIKPVDRIQKFKEMLMARPEKTIAVVGHNGFFSIFSGGHRMRNCDVLWLTLSIPSGSITVEAPEPTAGRSCRQCS